MKKQQNVIRGQGFTLLEFLVVVLIIGILAAIAVPQYQMAVAKARFTQLQILGNGLKKAVQLYFLANGEYTQDFTQLDLEMPGTIWPDKRHVYLGNKSCGLTVYESGQDGEIWCTYDSNRDWGEKGTVPLWSTRFRPYPIVCRAYSALQNKLCRSLAVNPVECTPSGNGTYCQYVIVSSF